ncbi:SDR family NAD(P)-dependent oxidoreductase [Solimicrobium silvestre]|uniref:Dehydrogenases with different specificities (Related to short-chain alcohol dehydrogenases) n=1 Tax=Solimicrobium silvestre TaxID=2099400 RepID=A0A2S9GVN1_9BURK|nr:SDR family NAD(P)-dependent oxidoreductase [Solimicrobium silvestre]PRC91758.1 Dehydrogenases with different specificities (related to short-chain alcohol dehydrogenases) [Solimicrobium silvestre]
MTDKVVNLKGKHALVTGGTRGIGLAIAQALLQQGAKVTIVARSLSNLQQVAEKLSAFGEVNCVELDLTDSSAVAAAFNTAVAQFGPIAILVNNAGQAHSAPFMKTDLALFNSMLSVNLTSVLLCTQAVLPGMLEMGWGRIVNVASTAGLTGYGYASAYCATKHAVIGLTRSLALEVAKKGITVNAVCPGYTETDLIQQAIANIVKKTGRTEEQARAELAASNPQGRLVQVEEVANAVAWLCMPASSAMNGQAIPVDGGELM